MLIVPVPEVAGTEAVSLERRLKFRVAPLDTVSAPVPSAPLPAPLPTVKVPALMMVAPL